MGESTGKTAPAGAAVPPPRLLPRALALVGLLAIADLWASRHLQVGIANPGWLAPIIGAITAAAGAVDRLGMGAETKAWTSRLLTGAGRVISEPLLAALSAMALVVGLTVSSLVVIPSKSLSGREVRVVAVDGSREQAEKVEGTKPVRFLLLTTPFGKRYSLAAPGFLPATIDVPAFVGRTVDAERDLQAAPSVFFRPPLDALVALQQGRFVVTRDDEGTLEEIAAHAGHRGSFLVGRSRPVPPDWLNTWRLELLGEGASARQVAGILRDWNRTVTLSPRGELAPDAKLRAAVLSHAGEVVAEAVITVGRDPIADVAMRPVPGAADQAAAGPSEAPVPAETTGAGGTENVSAPP